MCDPLKFEMLANVKDYLLGSQAALYSGVFEYMPFREGIFDAVLCGYSLRDSIHLQQAIAEARVNGTCTILAPYIKSNGFCISKIFSWNICLLATYSKSGLKFKTL